MIVKKVIYFIIFLFLISGGMLTPVLLPYIGLEEEKPSQVQVDPVANPEGAMEYSKALLEQNHRNIDRIERAQIFGKWFVASFTVFIISGLLLLMFFIQSLFSKNFKRLQFKALEKIQK